MSNITQFPPLTSTDIVLAYRSWYRHAEAFNAGAGLHVFMDDLSDILRSGGSFPGWKESLLRASKAADEFSNIALRKIRESAAFLEKMNDTPSIESIAACGGEFATDLVTEIDRLRHEVETCETQISSDFPQIQGTSFDYTQALVQNASRFLAKVYPKLKPIELIITQMPDQSLFLAQVVTDDSGRIVCNLGLHAPITPTLPYLIIHEVLGHVLHFTQLKSNRNLSETTPHLLVLSLHTHEAFFIEAIAQVLTYFLLVKSSWTFEGKEHAKLVCLRHMRAQAMTHLIGTEILQGHVSPQQAVEKHLSLGSKASPDMLLGRYEGISRDLYAAKANLNYFASFQAVLPLAQLDEMQFFAMLPDLLTQYFTPETLKQFVRYSTETS